MAEPWLRGTLTDVDALRRQVLHSLVQATEDVERWCGKLSDAQVHARTAGLPSVAFHLRHIAGSLDRLLTYAEGYALSPAQLEASSLEQDASGSAAGLVQNFAEELTRASARVRQFSPERYEEERLVGRQHLPSTLGGLLVHCAEHTQRHVGQAITTAQVVQRLVPSDR